MMMEDVDVNMTPLIDVSFQLLIFFLLTINFKLKEGDLSSHLPKKGDTDPTPVEQLQDLNITLRYNSERRATTLKVDHTHFGTWVDGSEMIGNAEERRKMGMTAWTSYRDIKDGMSDMPAVQLDMDSTVPTGRVITIVDVLKEFVVQRGKQSYGKNVKLKFKGPTQQAFQSSAQ